MKKLLEASSPYTLVGILTLELINSFKKASVTLPIKFAETSVLIGSGKLVTAVGNAVL